MQIGIVAKKIGLSVDAIRFYEQRLAPKTAKNGRWLPTIWRKRRRNAGLRASRAGPGIQTQRDSGAFAGARESHAALRELRLALRSCNKELRKRDAHCPILRETNSSKLGNAK